MKYRTTKGELVARMAQGEQFSRQCLLKAWKRSEDSAIVEVCTHGKVKEWNCGCSFGCEMCGYSYECQDCHHYFSGEVPCPTFKLITFPKQFLGTLQEKKKIVRV